MVQKLVEPLEKDLVVWFKKARYGDQCQIVTRRGFTYTRLTKVSPGMVRWQVSGFTNRNRELSKTVRLAELLMNCDDIK
jgi:hypothetical protein